MLRTLAAVVLALAICGCHTGYAAENTAPFGWIDGGVFGPESAHLNSNIVLSGWAGDAEVGSPVARIDIRLDGTKVGEATLGLQRDDLAAGDPSLARAGWTFSYNVGHLSSGWHQFTAIAYDSQGASRALPAVVVLGANASVGQFEDSNETLLGWIDQGPVLATPNSTVRISGWALQPESPDSVHESGSRIASVDILLDGQNVGKAVLGSARSDLTASLGPDGANAGWSFSYKLGDISPGTHHFTAVASNFAGDLRVLDIFNDAGTFTVPNGAITGAVDQCPTIVERGALLTAGGWVGPASGSSAVSRIVVQLDGLAVGQATIGGKREDLDPALPLAAWTFSYNVGQIRPGPHVLSAVAYDGHDAATPLAPFNNAGSFNVPNHPPFGAFDSGPSIALQNTSINLSGWAHDLEDGNASRVEILLDGAVIGNALLDQPRSDLGIDLSSAGWTFPYDINSLVPGPHTFTARAYDADGALTPLENFQNAGQVTILGDGTVTGTIHPLVADYQIYAPEGSTVTVQFGPDWTYSLSTNSHMPPPGGGVVHILVAGMRASSTYQLRAKLTLPDGTIFYDSNRSFTTGDVPTERLPQLAVTKLGVPANGLEQLTLIGSSYDRLRSLITDIDGNVVWYYDYPDTDAFAFPFKLVRNGNFLVNMSSETNMSVPSELREIDLTGSVVRSLSVSEINTRLLAAGFALQIESLHHDLLQLDNGHTILLCGNSKVFTDLPGFPGDYNVNGDSIVDLDESWNPVWVWSSFDHLDVNRHPMGMPDWTHSNALFYSKDGNLLLSSRHQSWIMKIDYQNGTGTGSVLWKLGWQGDFALPADSSNWFYAQHRPEIISTEGEQFTMVVFDNGNGREFNDGAYACDNAGLSSLCFSRGVVLNVDEAARTASVAWDFRPGLFSYWGGNAGILSNGDMETDYSQPDAAVDGSDVIESGPDGAIVWQMSIVGQNAYRAYRIPSLYPGVQW